MVSRCATSGERMGAYVVDFMVKVLDVLCITVFWPVAARAGSCIVEEFRIDT